MHRRRCREGVLSFFLESHRDRGPYSSAVKPIEVLEVLIALDNECRSAE